MNQRETGRFEKKTRKNSKHIKPNAPSADGYAGISLLTGLEKLPTMLLGRDNKIGRGKIGTNE